MLCAIEEVVRSRIDIETLDFRMVFYFGASFRWMGVRSFERPCGKIKFQPWVSPWMEQSKVSTAQPSLDKTPRKNRRQCISRLVSAIMARRSTLLSHEALNELIKLWQQCWGAGKGKKNSVQSTGHVLCKKKKRKPHLVFWARSRRVWDRIALS